MMSFGYTTDPTGEVSHRPWALPRRPWIMAQRWNDLLFLHWPVSAAVLRPLVPAPLELDLHGDTAWVSVTPFRLSRLRPRFLPALPFVSSFNEINVRTYVDVDGQPGVYFFSLDASQSLSVLGARAFYKLPYLYSRIHVAHTRNTITYDSRRVSANPPGATFLATYAPTGPAQFAEAGTLDHWLTERYCLYAVVQQRVYRTEIHHRPWPLQPARAEVLRNTMASAAGITLPAIEPRLAFVECLDVVVWLPERAN